MTPVKVNTQALLRRRWHDHYRFDDADLADLLLQRWHEREGLRWLELAAGRLMVFRQDHVMEKVAAAFAGLLAGTLGKGDAWKATSGRRLVRLDRHNLLAPAVAVYDPSDRWILSPKRAAVLVDFVTGANEERVHWGRRKYLRAGLRQHWLVDMTRGFMEIAQPGQQVNFRFETDREIPIFLDDVVYGTFKLEDLFDRC